MSKKSDRSARSILIVENDPIVRDALVKVLTLLGHYTTSVTTMADAAARLEGQQFAIVNIDLPDKLGIHVVERIRAERRPIRVAVISGNADTSLLDNVQSLAPELILSKPINVSEVLKWIQRPD